MLTPREVIDLLHVQHPDAWTGGTVRAHLGGLSVNYASGHHHPTLRAKAFLWQQPDGRFRRAAPHERGQPAVETVRAGRLPNTRRTDRMDQRSAQLIDAFPQYLAAFEQRDVFGGPSVYFHVRAIQQRRTHRTVKDAINDDHLLELIYAMLVSWGMHRMGPSRAKLVDFEPFRAGIRAQAKALVELEELDIRALNDAEDVAECLWNIISAARVSASGTQIVAGTKALHHLLPELVPPIDREYTIRFFHENKIMAQGDEHAFREVFPALARIASSSNVMNHLDVNSRSAMNTSPTKILDNAIIGYVWSELKTTRRDDPDDQE